MEWKVVLVEEHVLIWAFHRVGLARTCLTVCENANVVPIDTWLNEWLDFFKNIRLGAVRGKNSVHEIVVHFSLAIGKLQRCSRQDSTLSVFHYSFDANINAVWNSRVRWLSQNGLLLLLSFTLSSDSLSYLAFFSFHQVGALKRLDSTIHSHRSLQVLNVVMLFLAVLFTHLELLHQAFDWKLLFFFLLLWLLEVILRVSSLCLQHCNIDGVLGNQFIFALELVLQLLILLSFFLVELF